MPAPSRDIAFVQHAIPEPVLPEDAAIAAAVGERGYTTRWLPWNAPVDWTRFAAVLPRTCYGYYADAAGFTAWLRARAADGTRLMNSAAQILWNLDKTYLRALSAAGFAAVPTAWLERDTPALLADILTAHAWDDAVVKPTVSAGAVNTFRVQRGRAAAEAPRVAALLAVGGVMVQPFVPEVQSDGEWSLIYVDGILSHALLKKPAAADFRVQQKYGGSVQSGAAPAGVLATATRLMAHIGMRETPLYARVDGVLTRDGFLLMELELIEPYLYLATAPGAMTRFVDALVARLG